MKRFRTDQTRMKILQK